VCVYVFVCVLLLLLLFDASSVTFSYNIIKRMAVINRIGVIIIIIIIIILS